MSTFIIKTTAPGAADTCDPGSEVPSLALVLVWSASEPHRAGEIAFFAPFERRFVGRGDQVIADFALFGPQRPGETYAPKGRAGLLGGASISGRQLIVQATAVALDIETIGRCTMLVNGEVCLKASLKPGDTLMLGKEAVFVGVRRPRNLPAFPGLSELHVFGRADADGISGESPGAWDLRRELAYSATSEEHVLIRGETGTGKELAAAAVHRGSRRAKGRLFVHNCASFTMSLLEAELFGRAAGYLERGTPATDGIFGSADGSTLFLDEIGECPPEAQASLLRALESGECKRIGETIPRKVDVRVIGGTHRDDSFLRPDFRGRFTRSIVIPPLRERPEDIGLILRQLMLRRAQRDKEGTFAARFFRTGPTGWAEPRISVKLVEYLLRQPLHRNVRELEEHLTKAIDASPGDEVKLPDGFGNATPTPSPPPPEKVEVRGKTASALPSKTELVACLDRERGNVSQVARKLGLSRGAVYRLMESVGIKREDGDT